MANKPADDIDLKKGILTLAETHKFSLDDKAYTIDLAPANFDMLVKALAPFVSVAKPAERARSANRRRTTVSPDAQERRELRAWAEREKIDAPTVRRWCADNNVPCPAKGQVAIEALKKYKAAYGK